MDQNDLFDLSAQGLLQIDEVHPADAWIPVEIGPVPVIPLAHRAREGAGVMVVLGKVPDEFARGVVDPQGVGSWKNRAIHQDRDRPMPLGDKIILIHVEIPDGGEVGDRSHAESHGRGRQGSWACPDRRQKNKEEMFSNLRVHEAGRILGYWSPDPKPVLVPPAGFCQKSP